MNIHDLIRGDYAAIAALAERRAPQCAEGSAEQVRWLRIAENYRLYAGADAETGPELNGAMRPETL